MAGGALYLALGVVAALLERSRSGLGQVIDAAIVDGAASLATVFYGLCAAGLWQDARGTNILDSGAPFYDVYECADGAWISVGPIEARFYAQLLEKLELRAQDVGARDDRAAWPRAKMAIASRFRTRTRDAWCALLEGSDVCFAPVLSFEEAPAHAHLKARGTFVEVDGVVQPAPAPRFGRTPPATPRPPSESPDSTLAAVLARWAAEDEARRLGRLLARRASKQRDQAQRGQRQQADPGGHPGPAPCAGNGAGHRRTDEQAGVVALHDDAHGGAGEFRLGACCGAPASRAVGTSPHSAEAARQAR